MSSKGTRICIRGIGIVFPRINSFSVVNSSNLGGLWGTRRFTIINWELTELSTKTISNKHIKKSGEPVDNHFINSITHWSPWIPCWLMTHHPDVILKLLTWSLQLDSFTPNKVTQTIETNTKQQHPNGSHEILVGLKKKPMIHISWGEMDRTKGQWRCCLPCLGMPLLDVWTVKAGREVVPWQGSTREHHTPTNAPIENYERNPSKKACW